MLDVSETPTDSKWFLPNTIGTLTFAPVHLFVTGVLFFSYLNPKRNWPTYVWSVVQILMSFLSMVTLFGPVAAQITLLYSRNILRTVSWGMVAMSGVTMAITFGMFFGSDGKSASFNALIYQILINGPTVAFLVPFMFYLNELDDYMAKNYADLYNNDNLYLAPNPSISNQRFF